MSETNGDGVLNLCRDAPQGILAIRFDENSEKVLIDVVHVSNQWAAIDAKFRDKDGKVPPEKFIELDVAAHEFAAHYLKIKDPAALSVGSAWCFLKFLADKEKELKAFFEPSTGEAPSSAENMELIFSP
jgi:hypothetical protein